MDRIAITMSGLCLLHCLIIPVVVVLAPAFSSVVLGTETTVHWIFLALAVPISCWALLRGYRRSHRRYGLLAGLVGLFVMFLGVSHLFDPALEVPLTVLGVSLIVVAHAMNLRRQAIQ
ncbi:MAG: MerC domain-containing protein [Gammaproteobacteria bacterium]|nr:MerC domain-containing protein [Gammaproteobacteria bacterium]